MSSGIETVIPKVLAIIGCLTTLVPAFAQDELKMAPARLTLQVTTDPSDEQCRRIETSDPASLAPMFLHRTFHDDFDEHPLSKGKWAPHYAGGASWPEARYWGGDGSDFKRKTTYNGKPPITANSRSMWIHAIAAGEQLRWGSTRSRFEMAFSRSLQAARLLR